MQTLTFGTFTVTLASNTSEAKFLQECDLSSTGRRYRTFDELTPYEQGFSHGSCDGPHWADTEEERREANPRGPHKENSEYLRGYSNGWQNCIDNI